MGCIVKLCLVILLGSVSGILEERIDCSKKGYTWPVEDELDFYPKVASFVECEAYCSKNPACKGYTWYQEIEHCVLFSSGPKIERCKFECISSSTWCTASVCDDIEYHVLDA